MSNPIKVIKLTGVSGSLEGKADVIHDHVLSDITDAGTAASANTSDFATSTQGTKADNAIQAGSLASINADITDATLIDTTDPRLSDSRTPTTHSHTLSEITDSGSSAGLDVATVGNAAAGEVVKGNDSRLSDDRDPTAHTHTLSDISDSGTAAASDTNDFATAAQGVLADNATTKLAGIDAGATDDQTGAEIKALYETETKAFTDPLYDKLDALDVNATPDQTGAEIKALYEAQIDTNAFTDSDEQAVNDVIAGEYTRDDQTSVLGNGWVINDATMATATSSKLATSSSIKSYVDSLTGTDSDSMTFKGDYNAATNTPDLDGSAPREPVATGDAYIVSADGQFWTEDVTIGTLIIANTDDPSSLTGWEIVSGANQLSQLSDVTTAAVTDKFALMADGASYVGRPIVEADISDLGTYSTASSTETLTNKTFDANGTGNSLSNVDVADLSATGTPSGTTYLRGDNTWATVSTSTPDDTAYGVSWDGDTTTAPSKNAVYDKIETLGSGGQVDSVVAGTNITVDNSDPVNPVISASGGGGGGTVQGNDQTYDISTVLRTATPNARGEYSVDLQLQGNSNDVSSGTGSALIGGSFNMAAAQNSFIAGGTGNEAITGATASVILASNNSRVSYNNSAIIAHTDTAGNTTLAAYNSAIVGGSANALQGQMGGGYSAVIGGQTNSCFYQERSVILGGTGNQFTSFAGDNSVIGGTRVKVDGKSGVFAWGDSTNADFTVTQSDSAQFRVANGLHSTGPLFLSERSTALPDIAAKGQLWVKNETPNELWFTDDAGNDNPLTGATYGMLYNNANTANSVCSTTPTVVGWASTGSSSGTTPSTSSNIITIPTGGTYRVEANICCTTDTAGEYKFEIYYYNGTSWSGTGFVADREMPNNGDVGSATVSGIINIATTSPASAVAVYQSIDAGSTSNFLVQSGQLVVTKL